jgi:hypothetical protein
VDRDVPRSAAVARALATAPTGSALVRMLEVLDPAGPRPVRPGAFVLVEAVAAAARMASWAYALQARLAAELARCPDMAPFYRHAPGSVTVTAQQSAVQALAMRLLRSDRQTAALVRHGLAFDGLLADTGAALTQGRIDTPRAQLIADRLHEQTWQVATAVQDRVLQRAEDRTPAQVRHDLERALAEVDPEHAAERHAHARTRRRVSHPRPEPDGMASLHVLLPAPHAVAIDTALEDCARTARTAGDPRTLDQLRADGLVDLFLHRHTRPEDPAHIDDTGETTEAVPPANPADTPGGADSMDLTQESADALAPAVRASSRAPSSADPPTSAEPAPAPTSPTTEADADATAPDPGSRSPGPHGPADARVTVLVTVPLSTLIGIDDHPGDLAGYGPLDAVQTRALARGGTWQRLITDPLSGTLLDHGRTRYRPPAALDAHVRHRDKTCSRPGCRQPAIRCDLDHTDPFPHGTTSADNLGPLCRTHHRHKTAGTLTLHQDQPGTFTWTDRTGHRYRTHPGTDQPREHLTAPTDPTAPNLAAPDPTAPPPDPGPPPPDPGPPPPDPGPPPPF